MSQTPINPNNPNNPNNLLKEGIDAFEQCKKELIYLNKEFDRYKELGSYAELRVMKTTYNNLKRNLESTNGVLEQYKKFGSLIELKRQVDVMVSMERELGEYHNLGSSEAIEKLVKEIEKLNNKYQKLKKKTEQAKKLIDHGGVEHGKT